MSKKIIIAYLLILALFTLILHTWRFYSVPPGLNADEAAYGYNAFALLKTGADEFGNKFPFLRLQSFGDYKLPLYTYLTVPFVALLGLSEVAVRLPTLIAALLLPMVMYVTSFELFRRQRLALIAATLTALSPWVNMISRHAHEVVPASLFLLTAFFFLMRFNKQKHHLINGILFAFFLAAALYTYHIARLFVLFFIGLFIVYGYIQKMPRKKFITLAIILGLLIVPFLYAEVVTPPARLANLFIGNNAGITLKSSELKTEFARDPFGTRAYIVADEIVRRYISYFSPEFMLYKGDANPRFGYDGMGPINLIEYALFFVGLFFSIRYKSRSTFVVLLLLLISPFPGALTWQEHALTRSYFMIFPFLIIVSFGADYLLSLRMKKLFFLPVATTILFFILTAKTWFFFFFHYPHRATVIRAWLAGYKSLAQHIQKNYDLYDKFYITREVGQPYIFLLFYLQYSPEKFIRSVETTPPDEYGYTQVTAFDKFVFTIENYDRDKNNKKVLYVMSQSEGASRNITEKDVEKIKQGTEEMFWIKKF